MFALEGRRVPSDGRRIISGGDQVLLVWESGYASAASDGFP